MRNSRSGVVSVLLLFFFLSLNLYSFDIDKGVKQTVKNYTSIKTIQSDISEHFYSKTKSGNYSGIYYSIGDSTVIYFAKPFNQSILIAKDSVYWYFPDDKKVYVGSKLSKSEIKSFQRENNLTFLSKLEYNYDKKLVGNIFSKKIKITITPKTKRKARFSGIIVYLHPKLNVITDVEYYDLGGNETMEQHFRHFKNINGTNLASSVSTIVFTPMGNIETDINYKNTVINEKIDRNKFDLKIPAKGIKRISLFNPKGGSK
ncbi:MAG: outer membrane lipoprotein-sorting protein [Proteobacteria bacterium]|nr:outer membrane lipoprotein-sorting protein [Pseudomonadota bacterium]